MISGLGETLTAQLVGARWSFRNCQLLCRSRKSIGSPSWKCRSRSISLNGGIPLLLKVHCGRSWLALAWLAWRLVIFWDASTSSGKAGAASPRYSMLFNRVDGLSSHSQHRLIVSSRSSPRSNVMQRPCSSHPQTVTGLPFFCSLGQPQLKTRTISGGRTAPRKCGHGSVTGWPAPHWRCRGDLRTVPHAWQITPASCSAHTQVISRSRLRSSCCRRTRANHRSRCPCTITTAATNHSGLLSRSSSCKTVS